MKKWNKTVVRWDLCLGVETDIKVIDWSEKKKTLYHKIHALEIISLPENRKALLKLNIKRVCICPTTERPAIMERLNSLANENRMISVESGIHSERFNITFTLKKGEQFTDAAVEVACWIFEKFGVKLSKYSLSNFIVYQETLFNIDGKWIPFASYLKVKHGLPDYVTPLYSGLKLPQHSQHPSIS